MAATALPHILMCRRCDHSLFNHCKGHQFHADYLQATTCVSRHCKHPLCSCVDFVEP